MEWNGCDTTKNVHVSMSAIEDLALYDVEKPFELWYPAEPHLARTNCKFVDHEVSVKDARADLEVLNLDTAGFEFIYHKSQCLPDADHGEILGVETYLNETINLVCDHLKAEAIVCYDWRVSIQEGLCSERTKKRSTAETTQTSVTMTFRTTMLAIAVAH